MVLFTDVRSVAGRKRKKTPDCHHSRTSFFFLRFCLSFSSSLRPFFFSFSQLQGKVEAKAEDQKKRSTARSTFHAFSFSSHHSPFPRPHYLILCITLPYFRLGYRAASRSARRHLGASLSLPRRVSDPPCPPCPLLSLIPPFPHSSSVRLLMPLFPCSLPTHPSNFSFTLLNRFHLLRSVCIKTGWFRCIMRPSPVPVTFELIRKGPGYFRQTVSLIIKVYFGLSTLEF